MILEIMDILLYFAVMVVQKWVKGGDYHDNVVS